LIRRYHRDDMFNYTSTAERGRRECAREADGEPSGVAELKYQLAFIWRPRPGALDKKIELQVRERARRAFRHVHHTSDHVHAIVGPEHDTGLGIVRQCGIAHGIIRGLDVSAAWGSGQAQHLEPICGRRRFDGFEPMLSVLCRPDPSCD
jgi:hypothetical protein